MKISYERLTRSVAAIHAASLVPDLQMSQETLAPPFFTMISTFYNDLHEPALIIAGHVWLAFFRRATKWDYGLRMGSCYPNVEKLKTMIWA